MIDLEATEERMRRKDQTLIPVQVKTDLGEKYQARHRKWQGIPSIAISSRGRLWSAFYTGGSDEGKDNFVILKKVMIMVKRGLSQSRLWTLQEKFGHLTSAYGLILRADCGCFGLKV